MTLINTKIGNEINFKTHLHELFCVQTIKFPNWRET